MTTQFDPTDPTRFEEMYRDDRMSHGLPAATPWDIGGPQPVVQRLVALGAITWWQFAISVALILVSTFAVARLAMRVYRTATLRTGARVRLRDLVPLHLAPPEQPVRGSS